MDAMISRGKVGFKNKDITDAGTCKISQLLMIPPGGPDGKSKVIILHA